MKILLSSFLIMPVLLSTSVGSKKTKTIRHYNSTVESKILRVYVTEPPSDESRESKSLEESSEETRPKRGKIRTLLDLEGHIRQKFAYDVTTTDPRVSVVCSPFSAMMPLGILLYGAGDHATEKEITSALGIKKQSRAHDYFKDLRKRIRHLPEVTTHLASRIYIHEDKLLSKSFKEQAEDTFGSCVQTVDMKNAANVASEINEWVRHHTDDKITDIIKPSDISPWTILMVVDTLYFAGIWKYKFQFGRPETFYGANGKHTVNLMKAKQTFTYGSSKILGAQVIQIPYKGDSAYMLVVLPDRRDGLGSLLRQLKLAPELINKVNMAETYVELYLPKFKIESLLDLKVLYQKIGLKEIFMEGTGFSDIVKHERVKLDGGIQKTIIEVNELGTIAAAASVAQGYGAVAPEKTVVFKADHPFLFFVIAHKQQLFAGTFVG